MDLKAVVVQAAVDLVHLFRALLDEASVERRGIIDFGRTVDVGQGQHHAVVVAQECDGVVAWLTLRVESEILHEEGPRLLNVRDGEVEVVQDHCRHSAGAWCREKSRIKKRTAEDISMAMAGHG